MTQRIAIIEDDVAIAKMYQFKLEQNGYEVKVALGGKEGLELAKEFAPALIMLDLMMPEMTGDEVLANIRAADWGKSIRVVVLTNITREEATAKLASLNVDRIIVKAHYTPAQVLELITDVLK